MGWGSDNNRRCESPPLPAGLRYVEIAAGGQTSTQQPDATGHSLARRSDGTLVGWGDNKYGKCNIPASLASADQTIRGNDSYLDTEYKGIEFTATKRFTAKWQMQAGFTIGRNEGGLNTGGGSGQNANDLNDPNNTVFQRGIIGNDSETAFSLPVSWVRSATAISSSSITSKSGIKIRTRSRGWN